MINSIQQLSRCVTLYLRLKLKQLYAVPWIYSYYILPQFHLPVSVAASWMSGSAVTASWMTGSAITASGMTGSAIIQPVG